MNNTVDAMSWDDSLLVAHAGMDAEHQHFVTLIHAMQVATDAGLPAALDALVEHATSHFSGENASMAATAFPARECHEQEHEAVLATLRGVRVRLARGEHGVARAVAAELAVWFPAHVQQLDSALSHWMTKSLYGGKPIVLQRRRQPESALG
jgi:hemerythrin